MEEHLNESEGSVFTCIAVTPLLINLQTVTGENKKMAACGLEAVHRARHVTHRADIWLQLNCCLGEKQASQVQDLLKYSPLKYEWIFKQTDSYLDLKSFASSFELSLMMSEI